MGNGDEKDPVYQEKVQKFLQLMTANQSRIYGYILSLLVCGAEADDAMQKTAMVLWQKFDEFEIGTNFVAWAMTIARYQVLNHLRQQNHKSVSLDPETLEAIAPQAEQYMSKNDNRIELLRKCIQQLEARDKQIISLRYHHEQKVHTVAEMLGKKEKTIYKALARIQILLGRCIRLHLSLEGF